MTPLLEDRLHYLEPLVLGVGSHAAPNNGLAHACVMEAVAYVAGEPWSDHPECASPVIGAFLRSWNDSLSDGDRQMLKPLIPRLVGTRASKGIEEKRAWLATDWLARECAPAYLRLAGLTEQAELLDALAPLTTTKRAEAAQPTLRQAQRDAIAARAAAWAAAGAAAGDAAWTAAGDAAWTAARDAAWTAARAAAWTAAGAAAGAAAWDAARAAAGDAAGAAAGAAARAAAWTAAGAAARAAARAAAWAAARAAAGAAARDAARAALEPTVKQLQQSALLLVDRMIALSPSGGAESS